MTYITTPIYYPNAEPHLGHCYTTIIADTLARYSRIAGRDTFFLTGTDEHGIKMVKTAAEKNMTPEELVERNVAVFKQVWKELDITYDDFIRTTEPRHTTAVQEIVRRLLANGDIYLGTYEGWYDEGQEEFVTETEAKANEYRSAVTGKPLVRYKEPSYFFRLRKYVPRLLEYIEQHPDFISPEARRNEVASKLRAGVDDLSISRATLRWGIPMPNDPTHVIYVWIDALSNYITALGFASADESKFRRYWPADVHLIGKEILWFHTVYWPAMLMSLGLPLPKKVLAHGWWTCEGRKMSKSLGNFIDLAKIREVCARYSRDAFRYYLLRAAPFGGDLDWKDEDLQRAFNELANVVGNCLNRTVKMLQKYRGGVLPPSGPLEATDRELMSKVQALPAQVARAYEAYELQQCALLPVDVARAVNQYIDTTSPFTLAKDPTRAERLDTVLHLSAQAIARVLRELRPVLPQKSEEGLRQLGLAPPYELPLRPGHRVLEGAPLFPRPAQS